MQILFIDIFHQYNEQINNDRHYILDYDKTVLILEGKFMRDKLRYINLQRMLKRQVLSIGGRICSNNIQKQFTQAVKDFAGRCVD